LTASIASIVGLATASAAAAVDAAVSMRIVSSPAARSRYVASISAGDALTLRNEDISFARTGGMGTERVRWRDRSRLAPCFAGR
jgi:hypothetical protein